MTSAVVVGGGPNGLAAATVLAAAGVAVTVLEAADEVGGGARSHEPLGPGLRVDHCAGFHPMAVSSPALAGLEEHGLRWARPEIDCAHPLDDGTAPALYRSVRRTAEGLDAVSGGRDGRRWRALFEANVADYDRLAPEILGPVLHVPRHPLRLARFGAPTLLPGAVLARAFAGEPARALFAGVAAHAMRPLTEPLSSAIGLGILTAGHRDGWPVAVGGTGAITEALVARLRAMGGTVETARRITSLDELPRTDVTVLDLTPRAIAALCGEELPAWTRRTYARAPHGIGSVKLDLAVRGGVPWTAEAPRRAGTVHLGGTLAEVAAAEREAVAGRMPARPFTLVGQQYLADPSRSVGDVHPVYVYAHVPFAHDDVDGARAAILAQLERFAPGVTDRVVDSVVTGPDDFAAADPNMVGGDILAGAKTPLRLLLGPRLGPDPYRTGRPGTYLCSAAAPPGPGAHGMGGWHAARRALADLDLPVRPLQEASR